MSEKNSSVEQNWNKPSIALFSPWRIWWHIIAHCCIGAGAVCKCTPKHFHLSNIPAKSQTIWV